MKLFGKEKEKENEVEDDELDPEEKSDKKPSKTVRRRKKKEKPKEWGRRERLIVLTVLILTVTASGVLALVARNWKLPGIPRIKVPEIPSISLLTEETIYLEPNKDNLSMQDSIKSEFDMLTRNLSGVYGLSVIKLSDGFSVGINSGEDFEPASLGKLPVMMTAYRRYDKEMFDLDAEYVLKDSDKIGGSGSLSLQPAGTILIYRAMLSRMGKESDNTSFGILRKTLGNDTIDTTIRELGLKNTSLVDNVTTPDDIAHIFKELYSGSYITPESADEFLVNITDTIYESWIPEGTPEGVRVAHKFGREVHVVNDAGIVYADEPYVIVVMSKGIIEKEADEVIPLISKMVYEIVEGN